MKKIFILGGGTFSHVRNHLALCAPAFGTTARILAEKLKTPYLVLTKMAWAESTLVTNEDVEAYVDALIADKEVGCIVLNVAFCDWDGKIGAIESGTHADRLHTSDGTESMTLVAKEKIIKKIRLARPDIFLVGFKTTTNATTDEQFLTGLKMMKSTKCNLVLANDTVTRNNIIITPEESYYGNTTNRMQALNELCEILQSRLNATYNRSEFIDTDSTPIQTCSKAFQEVVQFLIDNGGYIENNGNGFTPGHFCERIAFDKFLSSQRKANHNKVFEEGMSMVIPTWKHLDLTDEHYADETSETFIVRGRRKASVGARSQWLLLKSNPQYDCIIHTHNPLKEGSKIPITPQKPFQCGSLECGMNTLNHLGDFGDIKAVYLEKHGANIMFKSTAKPQDIINFIKANLELGTKAR